MHRTSTVLLSLLLAAGLFAGLLIPIGMPLVAQASPETPPELLLEAAPTARAAAPASLAAARDRTVSINPAALGSAARPSAAQPARLTLTLFPEISFTARITARQDQPSGGYVLTGSLENQPDSAVTLSVQGSDLAGSVNLMQNGLPVRYEISPAGGLHRVELIDQSAYPAELDIEPPQTDLAPAAAQQSAADLTEDGSVEDGSVIDVMVVYDPAARDQMGGVNGSLAKINQAIAESNQGFANSGVAQRFALAHAAEVAYNENNSQSGGLDWYTALSQLTGRSDGVLDQVHVLRDAYAADLTVFLVADTAFCGLAWVMTNPSASFASNAFAVVAASCSTGYYSFAHELGHNMGSVHDRASMTTDDGKVTGGVFDYSYGYQDPGRAFRTIMAYNCPGGCQRVNHWSNPAVLLAGRPTGVAAGTPGSADNSLSLANTAAIVANFRVRQARPPAQPGPLVGTPASATSLSLAWTDLSLDETAFNLLRSTDGGAFTPLADLPADSISYVDSTIVKGSAYQYQVIATNPAGSSAPSLSNVISCSKASTPQNLTAAGLTPVNILLTWTDSTTETGYLLEWALIPEGPWQVVSDSIPADTVSFIDQKRAPDPKYYYRLQAISPWDESEPTIPVQAFTLPVAVYVPFAHK